MGVDVTCVGLTILDILGRPVERIPPGGDVEFIDEIRLTVAGTAAGTVIDCAKLGLKSRAVGAVGQDEKGDFVTDTYRRYGIDIDSMQHIEGVPTSATILNIRPNGDRPALHVRGASDYLSLDEKDFDTVCDTKYLHMGGSGLLRALDGAPTAGTAEGGEISRVRDYIRSNRAKCGDDGDRRALPAACGLFHAEHGGGRATLRQG